MQRSPIKGALVIFKAQSDIEMAAVVASNMPAWPLRNSFFCCVVSIQVGGDNKRL